MPCTHAAYFRTPAELSTLSCQPHFLENLNVSLRGLAGSWGAGAAGTAEACRAAVCCWGCAAPFVLAFLAGGPCTAGGGSTGCPAPAASALACPAFLSFLGPAGWAELGAGAGADAAEEAIPAGAWILEAPGGLILKPVGPEGAGSCPEAEGALGCTAGAAGAAAGGFSASPPSLSLSLGRLALGSCKEALVLSSGTHKSCWNTQGCGQRACCSCEAAAMLHA